MVTRESDPITSDTPKECVCKMSDLEQNSVMERVSLLESMLAQRQENIVQAWNEVAEQKLKIEELTEILIGNSKLRKELEKKLKDADEIIFKISGEKTKIEHNLGLLQNKLTRLTNRSSAPEKVETDTVSRLDASLAKFGDTRCEEQSLVQMPPLDRTAPENDASACGIETRLPPSSQEAIILQQRLEDCFREITTLSHLLRERDNELERSKARAEWLRMALLTVTKDFSRSGKARLISMLPSYLLITKQRENLRKVGLFDANAYVSIHPDVAQSDIDPFLHYILHGMPEGRDLKGEI